MSIKQIPCDACHVNHSAWVCDRCGKSEETAPYRLQVTLRDMSRRSQLTLDYCSPCARFVLGALARAADAAPRAVSGDSVEDFLK